MVDMQRSKRQTEIELPRSHLTQRRSSSAVLVQINDFGRRISHFIRIFFIMKFEEGQSQYQLTSVDPKCIQEDEIKKKTFPLSNLTQLRNFCAD